MVKNFGGKHGKKIARKNAHSNSELTHNKKMRFANGDQELYGLVTKCLGNSQFLIMCIDQSERLCVLRNKFTGRNKQGNVISVGSWVIIGVREWETSKPNKRDKCDMLEVYTNNEKHRLLEECKTNLSFLSQQENILLNIDDPEEKANEFVSFSEIDVDNNSREHVGDDTSGRLISKDPCNTSEVDDIIDIDEI